MTALEKNGQNKLFGLLLIVLHLVPGIIVAVFFFILSWILIQRGLTGYLALLITIPACLVPMEIGVMLLWSVRFAERDRCWTQSGIAKREHWSNMLYCHFSCFSAGELCR